MNIKLQRSLLLFVLILLVFFLFLKSESVYYARNTTIPSLPRPIAKEIVLITSAGQSTDTYIVKDIANKLMLHNYFMPQATGFDLEGIQSILVVVGYSDVSEKLGQFSFDEEKERINDLLKLAKIYDKEIITVYIGGKQRRTEETDALLDIVIPKSHYIISTLEGDYDEKLIQASRHYNIPITLVERIGNISEPLASAFR